MPAAATSIITAGTITMGRGMRPDITVAAMDIMVPATALGRHPREWGLRVRHGRCRPSAMPTKAMAATRPAASDVAESKSLDRWAQRCSGEDKPMTRILLLAAIAASLVAPPVAANAATGKKHR